MADTFRFQMNFIAALCIAILCIMAGVLIAGVLHSLRLAKYCVCPRYPDDVSFSKLLLFYLQVCNFWSDIYLLYSLYWMTRTYSANPAYLALTLSLCMLLSAVCIANFVFVYKRLIHWFYCNTNPFGGRWLMQRSMNHWFYCLLCVSGSVFHTVHCVNCKLFGVARTNMAVSQWNLSKVYKQTYIVWCFHAYSLSMLLIQTCTCLLVDAVYVVNMLSTVLTVLSMFIFCVHYHCCQGRRNEGNLAGLEMAYFQLNVECSDHHNDDEYKLLNEKEMRNKWRECIGHQVDAIDDNHGRMKLEIVCVEDSRNPNDQRFTVYGVCLDLDSYWIHLMQQCVDNDSFANAIQREFALDALPLVSMIDSELDQERDSVVGLSASPQANLSRHFLINSVDD